jgi:hypothetical protein
MQEGRKLGGRGQFRFRDWGTLDAAMGLRQKAAPGEGDNRPAMAGFGERDRGVDHSQPGTKDQDRRIRCRVPRTRVFPRAHGWRGEVF